MRSNNTILKDLQKNTHTDKIIIKSFLPELLISRINVIFENPYQRKRAIKVLAVVYNKYILEKREFTDYILFTKKYKLILIDNNNDYYLIYKKLYDYKILQKLIYKDGTTFSKKYHIGEKSRINPNYLKGNLIPVNCYYEIKSVKGNSLLTSDMSNELKIHFNKIQPIYSNTNEILFHLENERETICAKISSNIYKTRTGQLKYKANQISKPKLINVDKNIFINQQIEDINKRYINILNMAIEKPFEPQRNITNHRLDYLLTSFPKLFFKLLKFDNELIREIDLANSQLTILFNYLDQIKSGSGQLLTLKEGIVNKKLFNNREFDTYYCSDFWDLYEQADIQQFKKLVYNGSIYEELMRFSSETSNPMNRNQIKELVFSLIFGKYNSYRIRQANLLSLFFPNLPELFKRLKQGFELLIKAGKLKPIKSLKTHVINFKEDFNYIYGNNYLPIFLQRLESEIFIDHLLPIMYLKNICCLPKHDSILIPESAMDIAKKTMDYELSKFFDNNFLTK